MNGAYGGMMLLYGLIWIAVVVLGLTALWRGMRALEVIATRLSELVRREERS